VSVGENLGINYPTFDGLTDDEVSLVAGTLELYSLLNSTKSLGIDMPLNQFSKVDIDKMYILHSSYIKTVNERKS